MVAIQHAGHTVTPELVAFDVRWEGDLGGSTVVWSMVVSGSGAAEVRLCHERSAGGSAPAAQYVVDRETGRRRDVEPDADVDDGEVTVRFPADVVGVAVEWPVWTAVVTVDGRDVASQLVG